MMSTGARRWILACCCITGLASQCTVWAQSGGNADLSAEETRERQAAERFLGLLEKQPRLGTALDKVYGYHVERGTLDEFLTGQRKKTADAKAAGTAWMIIGLMELQRGRDGDAVAAFHEAEKQRADDAFASNYLGRALILLGRTDDAAKAYERAIARKPPRAELLELYQQLGQIYQRARKPTEALAVWDRLEKAFPDDLRVQEQIATILADENDHAGALARFEKLAAKSTDAYRKVQFLIRVGELKLRLGRSEEALKGLEALLGQLKPDSWLHRDVRQRIEATFLKTDDYDGLSKYYVQWLEKHPDDLDAMSRLANGLALQGRVPEAEEWYRKALKLAPTNKTLRRALIGQLAQAKRITDAVAEYAELDKLEPNNPDTLRAWGQLILEDKSVDDAARKQRATAVWKRLLAAKPKDPVVASQVADLFRQARLTDEAIELYKKAIDLAPNEPQYREYLGEYLHALDRGPEAVAVWKEIAAGNNKTTRTLIRLAEVYRGFGYREQSLETMAAACALDPEFADLLRYSSLLREATQFDTALAQLDRAGKLAENDDERDQVLSERIKVYVDSEKLTEPIAALEKHVDSRAAATDWRTLALLYEAARRPQDANKAIAKALALDDKAQSAWIVAARLYENAGQIGDAVQANEKLAALDRRARTDHLQRIATLNMRLGKIEEALKAGQDVIAAAPGNPEHYQFFAGLCFQVGRQEDGLNALRRAVRVNPSDQKALITLANALAEQFRTEESIELYWRAFDTADNVDDRNSVVTSMTDLYLRTNHFDRLVAKLERLGKEQKAERESTFWLATAHQAAGDVGSARGLLSSLLNDESKDTQLLGQLVKLAEAEYDFEPAIAYQKRINELAPSKEGQQRLAGLLMRTGAVDEAESLLLDAVRADRQPHKIYEAIDDMIVKNRLESALKLSEQLLRERPQDWEALYRSGLALWKQKKQDEAVKRFEQLHALPISEKQLSAMAEFQQQQAQKRGATNAAQAARNINYGYPPNYPPALVQQQSVYQIQQLLSPEDDYSYSRGVRRLWSPTNFGQARMVSPVVRFVRASSANKLPEIMADLETRLAKPDVSNEELWELYGQAELARRLDNGQAASGKQPPLIDRIARKLSERDDVSGKLVYISTMSNRPTAQRARLSRGAPAMPPVEPLPAAELDHLFACYRAVTQSNPEWYSWYGLAPAIAAELKLAKRDDVADELFQEALSLARDLRSVTNALQLALALGRFDDASKLLDKHAQLLVGPTGMQTSGISSLWTMVFSSAADKKEWSTARQAAAKAIAARVSELAAQPPRRASPGSSGYSGAINVGYQSANGNYRNMQLTFPRPNTYFDAGSIQNLYSIFAVFKEHEQLPEMLAFFTARGDEAEGNARLLYQLVTTYWLWWNDQKAEALERAKAIVASMPAQTELRMELANMLLQNGNERDALALLDGFEPADHAVLRDRELMAVQAAVQLGDVERAKKGSERLFGMQLDSNVQFQLAQLMHQLGMHEMADNVLTRIRKRSGNQTGTLAQLMTQYVGQGNNELAGQIALQLLRRGQPSSTSRYRTSDDVNREQALQVLQRTGQLAKVIERVEAQLAKSPNSTLLLESLAEYYKAAGQNDKAQALLERLTQHLPTDARALYARAAQLVRSNNQSAACDVYFQALKLDPGSWDNQYYEIRNACQRAKRMPDLAATILEIDFGSVANRQPYYRISNLASELMQTDDLRDAGMKVFKKGWEAFPQNRTSMLSSIYNEKAWQTEEFYGYAREAVVPKPGRSFNEWQGIADSLSYSGDGRVTGLLTRVAKMTQSPERREQFTADVAAGLKEFPTWHGGEAILAVFDAKKGDTAAAITRLNKLFDAGAINGSAAIVIAQEFDGIKELQPQAVQMLELGIKDQQSNSMNEYSYRPGRYLALLYHRTGERDKARRLIHELLASQDFSQYGPGNPGYPEYQELRSLVAAAQDFQKMDMPLDALRMYDQGLSDKKRIEASTRWGGSNMTTEMQRGRETAQKGLTPAILARELEGWVRMPAKPDAPVDAAVPENRQVSQVTSVKRPPAVVDLMLSVQPRSADAAQITSLFELAVSTAAGRPIGVAPIAAATPPNNRRPGTVAPPATAGFAGVARKLPTVDPPAAAPLVPQTATLTNLREQLAEAAGLTQDDSSVLMASAVLELVDPAANEQSASAAIAKLTDRVAAAPLTDQSPVTEMDLGVWLLVRLARKHPSQTIRDAVPPLSQRALAAARRQPDRMWLMAVLREQGQFAIDDGDRPKAEQLWSELLDEILRPRPEKEASKASP